jgi:hypothetical protein
MTAVRLFPRQAAFAMAAAYRNGFVKTLVCANKFADIWFGYSSLIRYFLAF